MKLTFEQGKLAVEVARRVVESHVEQDEPVLPDLPEIFNENRGVFVTLSYHPSHELRGCIGYPEPIMPLKNALVDAARSACSRDPRFPPVNPKELRSIVVEVSILTPPKPISVKDPKEYPKKIKIGRDGLIIRRGFSSGLLLPQVPVEFGWDEETFLTHLCQKAGLDMSAWMDKETKISSFEAQIFSETSPEGKVEVKKL